MLQIKSILIYLHFGAVWLHFINSAKKDVSLMISLIFDVVSAKYMVYNKL